MANENPLSWAKRNVYIQQYGSDRFVPFTIFGEYQFPFLYEIYRFFNQRARHIHGVVMKPVQMAVTTLALNVTYYFVLRMHQNSLYTLPVEGGQIGQFTHNRIDVQIENSPGLRSRFTSISNVGLKKAGSNAIYLRGMQSTAKLEEMPVGLVVRDELDRMNIEVADQAHDRLQGNLFDWKLDLSHPTSPGEGIAYLWDISSRGEWMWECPHCGAWQAPDWKENVDIENERFFCADCGETVDKADLLGTKADGAARYVHDDKDSPIRGWHFSQLLSPVRPLRQQIQQWNEAQGHPAKIKRFFNGVLGLPWAETGEKLTVETVHEMMQGNPTMRMDYRGGALGIDVGAGLHGWILDGKECVKVFHVGQWSDIDYYIKTYQPEIMVIDAEPEHHKALEYATSWTAKDLPSYVCRRTGGHADNKSVEHPVRTPGHERAGTITVNFTEQFDDFYAELRGSASQNIPAWTLPSDLPDEAVEHLCAPTRVQIETKQGTRGGWKKGINHFCDAAMYAMEGQEILERRRGLTEARPSSLTKKSQFLEHERPKRSRK